MHSRIAALSLALLLAACGEAEHMEDEQAAGSTETQGPSDQDVAADPDAQSEDTSSQADVAARYTEATPEKCTTLERETEEGSYVRQHCPGVGDYPLIVEEGDGRMFVHAGNEPETGETIGPFNILSPLVEWRVDGSEPYAIIYRLAAATPDSNRDGHTQLFVSKIGKGDAPSCLIAEIAGSFPQANIKAREVADGADDFDCAGDEKQSFGDIIR